MEPLRRQHYGSLLVLLALGVSAEAAPPPPQPRQPQGGSLLMGPDAAADETTVRWLTTTTELGRLIDAELEVDFSQGPLLIAAEKPGSGSALLIRDVLDFGGEKIARLYRVPREAARQLEANKTGHGEAPYHLVQLDQPLAQTKPLRVAIASDAFRVPARLEIQDGQASFVGVHSIKAGQAMQGRILSVGKGSVLIGNRPDEPFFRGHVRRDWLPGGVRLQQGVDLAFVVPKDRAFYPTNGLRYHVQPEVLNRLGKLRGLAGRVFLLEGFFFETPQRRDVFVELYTLYSPEKQQPPLRLRPLTPQSLYEAVAASFPIRQGVVSLPGQPASAPVEQPVEPVQSELDQPQPAQPQPAQPQPVEQEPVESAPLTSPIRRGGQRAGTTARAAALPGQPWRTETEAELETAVPADGLPTPAQRQPKSGLAESPWVAPPAEDRTFAGIDAGDDSGDAGDDSGGAGDDSGGALTPAPRDAPAAPDAAAETEHREEAPRGEPSGGDGGEEPANNAESQQPVAATGPAFAPVETVAGEDRSTADSGARGLAGKIQTLGATVAAPSSATVAWSGTPTHDQDRAQPHDARSKSDAPAASERSDPPGSEQAGPAASDQAGPGGGRRPGRPSAVRRPSSPAPAVQAGVQATVRGDRVRLVPQEGGASLLTVFAGQRVEVVETKAGRARVIVKEFSGYVANHAIRRASAGAGMGHVAQPQLALRAEPQRGSPLQGVLPSGIQVRVLAHTGRGRWLRIGSTAPIEGWVPLADLAPR